ncbi:hypothetical protein GCM10007423_39960 [Dyadobacter endophyticus]|uniref:Uncharacterized protein n=1 Tax=Dyadobacter endophyticus TaxID=1749036 RepID=A0ABQ1YYW3_9BACT|nr:hypothetical protein [Dyadobacter endophyticus]GGH42949.1 hypothetical protein GCM10007423_39960 [Dyadobacter endophyticus]
MIQKSDSREVYEVALSLQSLGKIIDEDLERELLRAGADVVVVVSHRIKRAGEDATGRALKTKAKKTDGGYSKRYAARRREKGRQIDRVDLFMDGDLMPAYNLTERSPRSVGVGFTSDEMDERAEWLENYYGTEIFVPSEKEEDEIMDDAMSRIENLIEKI